MSTVKKKQIHVVKFKTNDGEVMNQEVAKANRLKQEFKKFNAQEKYEIEDTQGWVAWGQDNMRPQYLGFLYKNSGLHRAIIDGFAQMAAGLGTGNAKLDDCLVPLFLQFGLYRIAPLEIVWSRDGLEVAEMNVLSMANIRFSWDRDCFKMNGAYYSRDWTQPKSKRGKATKLCLFDPLARFGKDEEGNTVLVQPKQVLFIMWPSEDGRYYPDPSYEGGINWIEIDRQTSEFHRNSLENGLFPSMMITVKGTSVGEEDAIIDNLEQQLQGASNTGKFVVNFTDIDGGFEFTPITTNDADKLYQWHVDTAAEKILQAHGVVSPLLFGIRTATGFGGNADEMKVGEAIYNERVIKPVQKLFERELSRVIPNVKITPKPSFFQTETAPVQQSELEKKKFDENFLTEFIEVNSDAIGEDWIEIDSYEVDPSEDDESADKFVSTGTARPNARSAQDKTIDGVTFYARYVYDGNNDPERPFCKKMMAAGKVYRKEDILAMNDVAVNPGWGPRGANTYSIWLYKGGANCYHYWRKVIYVSAKDLGVDINSPNAKTIAIDKAKAKGFNPRNQRLVPVKPIDMPNQGFLPKD